ncbi:MAG: hypothetical protein H6560_25655 [Lewinellaceae bacterium]|nr:hypothetical protein [Lewinellaceae bacterium]
MAEYLYSGLINHCEPVAKIITTIAIIDQDILAISGPLQFIGAVGKAKIIHNNFELAVGKEKQE